MKLLYLTTKDFSGGMKDGVVKKVKNQIKCFEKYGYKVDYTYVDETDKTVHFVSDDDTVIGRYNILGGVFNKKIIGNFLKSHLQTTHYDGSYIRFLGGRTDPWHLDILKVLKQNHVRTVLEFPTFPYDAEGSKVETFIDRCFRGKLKDCVDRISTYSPDEEIFGVKTIQIFNGIDVDSISLRKRTSKDDTINFIAVASFEVAHGYERIIDSIGRYYQEGGKREIRLHLVGDGVDRSLYEDKVRQYGLENRVTFYGKLFGDALDEAYEVGDIALGCLGLYKKKIEISSALKVREYLAKGLPVVSGCTEDVLEKHSVDFYLRFANDSSPIDMVKIVEWYDALLIRYNSRDGLMNTVRAFAEKNVDMYVTMKEVVDYIREESV